VEKTTGMMAWEHEKSREWLERAYPLAALRSLLGRQIPIARAMPSPMCTGGRGLTALVFPEWTEKDQRAAVRVIFERFGAVVEIS
jgi:pyrroline-5-carboxylate reductase